MVAVTAHQRSFEDLGTPLRDVTFCVIDLETTGGSPDACEITEVGAVKVRGGECLGTFQTLVNPGVGIPREITVLTGITEAMVVEAPRLGEVIASLVEFVGDSVIVGHNVRFDLSFLKVAYERFGYPPPTAPSVDTLALARRLVRDEVPNCKLGTLASRFRLSHPPTHRALDDALATTDLLHLLLERAGSMGVTALDDLLSLPTIKGHPQQAKLSMTTHLPRAPGVYMFRGRDDEILYVGKAADLRSRVRSYFSGDDRRKIGRMLTEMQRIDHVRCAGRLEAAVLEVRLIHEHLPRYNTQSRHWPRYAYVKLTLDEPFPRVAVARVAKPDDGCLYLGPLSSQRAARRIIEAIQTAVPIRRCNTRIRRDRRPVRQARCAAAQIGAALCPCAGDLRPDEYAPTVERVIRGLTVDAAALLDPLAERMGALAAEQRYEEAADVRSRADALAQAVARQQRIDALRRAGTIRLDVADGERAVIRAGLLSDSWHSAIASSQARQERLGLAPGPAPHGPLPRHLADEVVVIDRFLRDHADRVRLIHADEPLALPWPPPPSFTPRRSAAGDLDKTLQRRRR